MKLIRSHPVNKRDESLWPYQNPIGHWDNFDSEKDLDILMVGPRQFKLGGDFLEYQLVHNVDFPKDNLTHQFAVLMENYHNRMHPGDMVARIGRIYYGLRTDLYEGESAICRRIVNAYTCALWEIMNGHAVGGIWERKGAIYLTVDPVPSDPQVFGHAHCWGTKKPFQDDFRQEKSCIDLLQRNQLDAMLYGYDTVYSFTSFSFDGNTDEGQKNMAYYDQFLASYDTVFRRHRLAFQLDRYDMNRMYSELEKQITEFIEKIKNGEVVCPTLMWKNIDLSAIPAYVKWRVIRDTIQIIEDSKCRDTAVKTIGGYLVLQANTDKIVSGGAFLANNFPL